MCRSFFTLCVERILFCIERACVCVCARVCVNNRGEGSAPDDPNEVLVKLDSAVVLRSLRMPRSVLVPIGAPARNMRLWGKCTEAVKRDLLLKVGVRDPRDEVLPSSAEVSLTMWGEYVGIGLRLDEEIPYKFVSPFFAEALQFGADLAEAVAAGEEQLKELLSFGEIEDQSRRQNVRTRLLREWWSKHEVLLVCIVDKASGSLGLLAVRKEPVSVRFYEVGAARGEAIAKQASLVLRILEGVADEVPLRCNCAVHGAEDLMAHYIEAEIREAVGETRGCLGWPSLRLKKVPVHACMHAACMHPASHPASHPAQIKPHSTPL